jgi:hypothetical protein
MSSKKGNGGQPVCTHYKQSNTSHDRLQNNAWPSHDPLHGSWLYTLQDFVTFSSKHAFQQQHPPLGDFSFLIDHSTK